MDLIYALEDTPETLQQSIYLAGPSPRRQGVPSWRPQVIAWLRAQGYDGTLFIPEARDGKRGPDYLAQAEWEETHLNLCDQILVWVPRDLTNLPAFTTNVEFGRFAWSRKMIYGRPDYAPQTGYLDWLYRSESGREPCQSLEELGKLAIESLAGRSSSRTGGERFVPLHIWETEMFQQWYQSQLASGNRLDGATELWSFYPRSGSLLAYVLKVNLWVAAENRHKDNEFIFTRKNLASTLLVWRDPDNPSILETKVLLVREFRSPVLNGDSFVRELPSGSGKKDSEELALATATRELEEETGLAIGNDRFTRIKSRQISATLSTHRCYLFIAELTDGELRQAEEQARSQTVHGDIPGSEQTYVEIRTIGELLRTSDTDYSTMGMIIDGLAWLDNHT